MLRFILASFVALAFIESWSQVSGTWVKDEFGAIIRGDVAHRNIALVFSGDDFGDGADTVISVLTEYKVPASFFLSRRFYTNEKHAAFVERLIRNGHYVGLHPERTSGYVKMDNRDSTLITEELFKKDLRENYKHLAPFGIKKHDVLFFLPSCDCYNATIVSWSEHLGYPLIFQTPGTLLSADTTYPEQGEEYKNADQIYDSIVEFERTHQHGLNGGIIMIHLGTDSRRTDKFYYRLIELIEYLDHRGYNFVEINELLE